MSCRVRFKRRRTRRRTRFELFRGVVGWGSSFACKCTRDARPSHGGAQHDAKVPDFVEKERLLRVVCQREVAKTDQLPVSETVTKLYSRGLLERELSSFPPPGTGNSYRTPTELLLENSLDLAVLGVKVHLGSPFLHHYLSL